VAVCNHRYVVNVAMRGDLKQLNPIATCPPFRRPKPVPFRPTNDEAAAEGAGKSRAPAGGEPQALRSGLTRTPLSAIPSLSVAPVR
jgi:hypothetical protein